MKHNLLLASLLLATLSIQFAYADIDMQAHVASDEGKAAYTTYVAKQTAYYTGNYTYSTMMSQTGNTLFGTINTLMGNTCLNGNSGYSYNNLRSNYINVDKDLNNSSNIIGYYDGSSFEGTWDSGKTWNREHTWPQSKFKGTYSSGTSIPIGYDMQSVRPASTSVNSSRSNTAYGEGSGYYDPNEIAINNTAYNSTNNGSYRGDCARVILYDYVVYGMWDSYSNSLYKSGVTADLLTQIGTNSNSVFESLLILLKWHMQDPPSLTEMVRNDGGQDYQGNRNPFIDYPELAINMLKDEMGATAYTVTYNITETASPAYIYTTQYGFVTYLSNDEGVHPSEVVVTGATATYEESLGRLTITDVTGNVTISTPSDPTIYASASSITVEPTLAGESGTQTLSVWGANLTGNISLSVSGTNSSLFSVSPATIAYSTANNGTTEVTISYSPAALGSHTATLTLASQNAESVTITLNGSCTTPRTISWYVNGEEYTLGNPTTSVANGGKVQVLPTEPDSPSACNKTFVGWSNESIATETDSQPTILFTDADSSPAITANTAFYAVFADVENSPTTLTQSSFTTTVADMDSYISYAAGTGTASNGPIISSNQIRVYQNGGIFTITANNGATITSVTIGSSNATSITYSVDGGTTSSSQDISANGTYTLGNISAGTSVLFTCVGTSTSTRLNINYLSVTYEGGEELSITGFITTCGESNCTLSSISLNSEGAQTSFDLGDEFSATGLVLTANYTDCDSRVVTPSVSAPDMTTAGDKTVTISYTESGVTKTATYTIHVYDFRALEATNVSSNSFTANWTEANADNYSLDVYQKTTTQNIENRDTTFLSETFASSQGDFTIEDVSLSSSITYAWAHKTYNSMGYMYGSAYVSSTNYAADSWLISPSIDLTNATSVAVSFDGAAKFQNGTLSDEITLWIAENPSSTFNSSEWTKLTIPTYPTAGSWTFVSTGDIDISAYKDKNIKLAVRYLSTADAADSYELKNFLVVGKYNKITEVASTESVSGYPATVTGTSAAVSGLENETTYYYTVTPNGGTVSNEIEVTTTAQAVINTYTITFCNEDGAVLQQTTCQEGATPVYSGTTPSKTATAQYTYTFAGWSPDIAPATADQTYTAQFDATVNQYTLTVNGASGSGTYDYGTSVTLTPEPADNYHFTQWSDGNTDNPRIVNVTANATYTAQSEEDSKTTVYLFPTIWETDNAKFAAYVFEDGKAAAWSELMTATADGKAYTTQVYNYQNIIFVRLNKTATNGNWNDKWNQTADLTLNTSSHNCYQITGWGNNNSTGLWRNYPFYFVDFRDYDGSVLATDTVDNGNSATAPAAPSRTGYTFSGWDNSFNNVTADLTVTATYSANTNTAYKVEHYQQNILDDGYTLFETDNLTGVTDGNTAAAAKIYTGFTAQAFSQSTIAADGSTVVKVYYNRLVYEIKFVVEGSTMQTDNLRYGATPVFAGATPVKAATAQYTYTFAGWDTEIAVVTGNKTYTAVFTSVVNTYTITWKNEDGSVLETDLNVPYGATPSYDGATPAKAATAQYTYTFATWTPAVAAVTGDAVYTAVFTSVVNEYEVTFNANGHGTAPQSQTLAYGSKVVKPADPSVEGYTFGGWFKEATCTNAWDFNNETVSGAQTLFAKWVINQWTLTWDVNGGSALTGNYTHGLVNYGTTIVKPADPTMSGYTFTGWNPAVPATMPDADLTLVATWTESGNTPYKVEHYQQNILDDGYTLIETDNLTGKTGASITPVSKGYTGFSEPTYTAATIAADGSTVVKLYYNRLVYEIKFVVEGTTMQTDNLRYGAMPVFAGATPVKTATAQYTYTFAGWDTEIAVVTGNKTYTAVFTSVVNTYTITWKNEDGSVLETDLNVPYGATPSYDGATPAKAATAQYTYTFASWTPAVAAVTGDAVYTATFTSVVNEYEVTFNANGHGTAPQSQTLAYGSKVVKPADPSVEGYTFGGWFKEATCTNAWDFSSDIVKGNIELFAKWVINTHKLSWDAAGGTLSGNYTSGDAIAYGTVIIAPTATREGYNFSGWNPAFTEGMTMPDNDLSFIATWTEKGNIPYTVNHYQEALDGSWKLADTDNLTGTTGTNTAAVAKNYTGFTAQAFSQAAIAANGSTVVDIYYTRNSYTLTYRVDGVQSGNTETYKYGASVIARTEPAKEGYTFSGWDNVPSTMPANDVVVNGTFSINSYTLTYKVDGEVYKTYTVEYNSAITPEAEPVKTGYTFSGWDNVPSTMPANDVVVNGTFTVNSFSGVHFESSEGGTITVSPQQDSYNYGEEVVITAKPDEGYTFTGWEDANGNVISTETSIEYTVEGDATITAQFAPDTDTRYTVRHWLQNLENDEYTLDKEQNLTGTTATMTQAQADMYTGFIAKAFNQALISGDGKAVVDIYYDRQLFTILFVAEGETLQSSQYKYGATPAYNGTEPEKEGDAQYTYSFKGWTPEIVTVTADATYTAVFEQVVNTYVITFVNEDGNVLDEQTLAYGEMPEYRGETPEKAEDEHYTYSFSGWSPELAEVTGDAVYTAQFTATEKTPTGIESVIISGNSISGPRGMRIYDYTGKDVTGAKDYLYKGAYIIVVDGQSRKVMIP